MNIDYQYMNTHESFLRSAKQKLLKSITCDSGKREAKQKESATTVFQLKLNQEQAFRWFWWDVDRDIDVWRLFNQ